MRAKKALESGEGNNVTELLPECSDSVALEKEKEKEKDIEIDIEKETDQEKKKSADARQSVSTVSLESEFEILWKLYPRKEGKSNALKDYIKARKDKKCPVTMEEVQAGIKRYAAYVKANGITKRYIKQGSTWFHQHCWEDEYQTEGSVVDGKPTGDFTEARFGNYI